MGYLDGGLSYSHRIYIAIILRCFGSQINKLALHILRIRHDEMSTSLSDRFYFYVDLHPNSCLWSRA